MGRLQKKKQAHLKKKKSTDTDGSAPEKSMTAETEEADLRSGDPASGEPRTKKQKSLSAPIRRSDSEPSAIMKFLERYFGDWIQFFREVWVELSKVTWPSRKETIGTTLVVIVFVFLIAVFLGAVDIGLSSLVRLVL